MEQKQRALYTKLLKEIQTSDLSAMEEFECVEEDLDSSGGETGVIRSADRNT